jgi:hypothetical protein
LETLLDFTEELLHCGIVHIGQRVENIAIEIILSPLFRALHQLRQGEGLVAGSREKSPCQQKCRQVTSDPHGEM